MARGSPEGRSCQPSDAVKAAKYSRAGALAGRGHANRTEGGGKAVTRRKRKLLDRHADGQLRSASRRYPSRRRGISWPKFRAQPMPTTRSVKRRGSSRIPKAPRESVKGGKRKKYGTPPPPPWPGRCPSPLFCDPAAPAQ